MNTQAPLGNDLAGSLADKACAIVLAEVVDLRYVVDEDGKTETGLADFRVLETLRGAELEAGAVFAVPFTRTVGGPPRAMDARSAVQGNRWDALPLKPASPMLLALRTTAHPAFFVAVAGETNEEDPELDAVRRCLELRALSPKDRPFRDAVAEAFLDPRRRIVSFAQRVATEAPREACAEILEAVSQKPGLHPTTQELLAYGLASFPCFQSDRWADRTNVIAVESLVRGLMKAGAPDLRRTWLSSLANAFRSSFTGDTNRDAGIRRALVAQMSSPSAAEGQAAIEKVASPLSGSDRDAQKARETAKQLLELWKAAR